MKALFVGAFSDMLSAMTLALEVMRPSCSFEHNHHRLGRSTQRARPHCNGRKPVQSLELVTGTGDLTVVLSIYDLSLCRLGLEPDPRHLHTVS